MSEDSASGLADKILLKMVESQPSLFGSGYLTSANGGQGLATAIAAFRLKLIEELKNQPL